jgi:hypothetical protein
LTSSGLPTARGYFPPGTPRDVCIAHNRACKVARIAAKALELGCDDELTDEQMDAVAHEIGVNLPGSEETRDAVRCALTEPLTDDDPGQSFAEAVMAAAAGAPFRYTDYRGRTVLVLALPVGERPTVTDKPTPTELRRFVADSNMRRLGWALFEKGTRRTALRMARGGRA